MRQVSNTESSNIVRSIRLVVAVARNGTIGRNNMLPWRLKNDLQRFKRLTLGHALIMGRKTHESIGRLLPGRTTVLLTRQLDYQVPGAHVAHSIDESLALLPEGCIPFVVGGAELFREAFPLASHLYVTRVAADVDGDTQLDNWDLTNWRCVESEALPADAENEWPTVFEHWTRTPFA